MAQLSRTVPTLSIGVFIYFIYWSILEYLFTLSIGILKYFLSGKERYTVVMSNLQWVVENYSKDIIPPQSHQCSYESFMMYMMKLINSIANCQCNDQKFAMNELVKLTINPTAIIRVAVSNFEARKVWKDKWITHNKSHRYNACSGQHILVLGGSKLHTGQDWMIIQNFTAK